MNIILILLIIIVVYYLYKNKTKLEGYATFSVPPGTDDATAKAIGNAQEVGAQMCSNSELDHSDAKSRKKNKSCSE